MSQDASPPPPESPQQRSQWILTSAGHFSMGDAFAEAVETMGRFPRQLLTGLVLFVLLFVAFQVPIQVGSYMMDGYSEMFEVIKQAQEGEGNLFEALEQAEAENTESPFEEPEFTLTMVLGLLLYVGGSLVYGILSGPIWAGFQLLGVRLLRGDASASPTLVFAGFGAPILQLILASLLVGVAYTAVFLVMGILIFVVVLAVGLMGAAAFSSGASTVGTVTVFLGFLAVALVLVFIYAVANMILCLFNYAIPLVIDQGLSFWYALETSVRLVWRRLMLVFLWRIVVCLLYAISWVFIAVAFLFGANAIVMTFLLAFVFVMLLIQTFVLLFTTLADLSVYDQMFCRHLRRQP